MAEAERRPGKMPLLKQTEIEVEEEEQSQSDDRVHVNDTSIASVGNKNCQDDKEMVELGSYSPPVTANGAAVITGDISPSSSQSVNVTQAEASPVTSTELTQKINHTLSSKAKPLVRGTAICDSDGEPAQILPEVITTPAPDSDDNSYEYNTLPSLLGQDGLVNRATLQKNGSLSSDAGTSNCSLSRESSLEKNFYKDSSGCDLEEFIKKTLLKSKKDKQMLLSLERDFKIFVKSSDQHYQLAEMCSYDRMICHRVAAFYGMEHNIDKSGKCVIVSKTKFTRIPTFNCEEYVEKTVEAADDSGFERKLRLLKKPFNSLDDGKSRTGDKYQLSDHRTKSLEERQKTYEEKRKIIFGKEQEDPSSYSVMDAVTGGNKRLNSEWSSTESSGYMSEEGSKLRPIMITKSNSYGGKPTIHLTPNLRTYSLSKADSITSGSYESPPVHIKHASPDNSHSDSRSSSADVSSPNQGYGGTCPPNTVLVAMDINAIPPGSMVVNPHTLQPHINADGSPYRYNPSDISTLPHWLVNSASASLHHQPGATNLSFNPASSVQQVQYTSNDLCSRFSTLEVTTPLEGSLDSQQMFTVGHHPCQLQPAPQHHLQQPSQIPLMVSTAIQPSQHYVSSYAGSTQGPGFYTGTQLQFVPVDAQGQCLSSIPINYGHPQLVQTASGIQPGIIDQASMTPCTLYGQNVYTGTVTDTGSNANGYCVSYVPSNNMLYPSAHYSVTGNGSSGMTMTPAAAHYSTYNPPQSSSPQLACGSFTALQGAQVRPATPPSLPIAQPVGCHSQQATGINLGHGLSSPPHFQHGTYYPAPPHFPSQGQPVGQVVHMVRPHGGAGVSVGGGHTHHHSQSLQGHHQPGHPNIPTLQHSQSYPVIRTVPTSITGGPSPIGLGHTQSVPNPSQHPMISVKSMSMSSMRSNGGAATPDRDTPNLGGGTTAFLSGYNQATSMQFPGQFIAQSIRQPQPGELRVMGSASMRPQMTPSLIAFQPGQPVRNSKPTGPRHSRPQRRNNSIVSSNSLPTTTASASVARVMSHDSGCTIQQAINRQ